uniref:Uncharacterized protein n=1 Tax=Rhizophora mucronata TaxID=61149 RepID=A0A2P2P546_RHIMU
MHCKSKDDNVGGHVLSVELLANDKMLVHS